MISNKMLELDRREFITRAKALSEEQKILTARLTPTDILEDALRRRDEFCTDIIKALVLEINKIPDEPTIQDKERAIKECKAILSITEKRIR